MLFFSPADSCICVSLLKYHTELLCWLNERKAASENYVCGLIFQNPVIDMQKAADKRPEQPELAENLCAIYFSNVSKLRSSSFHSANNTVFHVRRKWVSACRFWKEWRNKWRHESNRGMFCTSSHKLWVTFSKRRPMSIEKHCLAIFSMLTYSSLLFLFII